uniref:Cytosolic fatty-acid binding proteins domain-containing protein n=1 Tax=Callorhinchus milii TaxID=7868 RepID=A0A4W3K495_CALMI
MVFSGKYNLESLENFDPFMKALGIQDEVIKKNKELKTIVEIVQEGNTFKITHYIGCKTIQNNFTIGQETTFHGPTGHEFKAVVNLEGVNKLCINMKGLTAVIELNGDRLIETLTTGETTCTKISKRI